VTEREETSKTRGDYASVLCSMVRALCNICQKLYNKMHQYTVYLYLSTAVCVSDGICTHHRPPLWSSGQSFWLQIQGSRVRSPELPDFLSSSGSGTGSTQPREVN